LYRFLTGGFSFMNIEVLRNICLSFPAATEDVKWENNLCFCIGGKIFCIANLEPPHTFSFKVKDEEFDELSETDGFKPAPYLAKAKWIMVTDASQINSKELKNYLRQSYDLIMIKLTRKQKKDLGFE
jgi:predicted DNA-binding protein (MmcQ/YjbR family)